MPTSFWRKYIFLAIGLVVIVLLLMRRREVESHNRPLPRAGEEAVRNIIERKVEALKKKRREKRRAYAALLGTIERERTLAPATAEETLKLCREFLAASLHDDDVESRIAAIEALGEVGDQSSVKDVFTARGVDDSRVREASVRAMAKLGGKDVSVYLIGVITTGGCGEEIFPTVAWAYGEAGSREHLSIFKDALKDKNAGTRIRIAEAIYKMGDESGIPIVKADLSDEEVSLKDRITAAEVLSNMGDKSGIPLIERALTDQKAEVRRAASAALIRLNDASSVPALKSVLTDGDAYVRINAAEALYRMGDKSGEPIFSEGAENKDWRIRRAVALAICELVHGDIEGDHFDDQHVRPLMEGLLDDGHEQVRAAAILALGELRDDSLMPIFKQALRDDQEIVRLRAAEALAKMALVNSAPSPERPPPASETGSKRKQVGESPLPPHSHALSK